MSPKSRATDVKVRLVEAAIRLLDENGPEALQARKLAAEVGVSTMAVYTHFGGMSALVDEVARAGFLRLSEWLAQVEETDDPVADIFSMARTYRQAVAEQPQLFAVTFGQSAPGGKRATLSDLTTEEGREAAQEGLEAFTHIVRATARAIAAGRFRPVDEYQAAAQLWSALHGFVTLEASGHFGPGEQGINHILIPLGITMAVGLGDTVDRAGRSAEAAKAAWRAKTGNAGQGDNE
ncbi:MULTISPECIES: TetR/AcrR family transcriptional regulator [unclassified Amycolatopsis]|uniref:TetR/AcrR family transcriptional regulator n=1 Tax=unclassified Amycolatopsis TaxID=2618356 RepID=UPI002875B17A|nr:MULTISPECIES: TetR/AcrR family transcriptional regulator [unclassified Amycolatopsis]MDS0136346.1 TetR/AcrR family transcriptional regulator [Amycolatopsis sp. 505]MDS0145861.1 TetR/AcrR family transcriptional regulator [Amycolatopsis sp. CM201R]